LEVEILGGKHNGEIGIHPSHRSNIHLHLLVSIFKLNPSSISSAVGIFNDDNKAQGQSVRHIGLDLWESVFSHGQLYVALPVQLPVSTLVFFYHQMLQIVVYGMLYMLKYSSGA